MILQLVSKGIVQKDGMIVGYLCVIFCKIVCLDDILKSVNLVQEKMFRGVYVDYINVKCMRVENSRFF